MVKVSVLNYFKLLDDTGRRRWQSDAHMSYRYPSRSPSTSFKDH